MQLSHGGVYGMGPEQAIGPSAIANQEGKKCQVMTKNEIRRVVAASGKAAVLAKRAGFDAV